MRHLPLSHENCLLGMPHVTFLPLSLGERGGLFSLLRCEKSRIAQESPENGRFPLPAPLPLLGRNDRLESCTKTFT